MYLRKICIGLIGLGSVQLQAADPRWWNEGIAPIIDPGASHATADNYAPVNVGQLKNFAKQAKWHMDFYLPGGAGQQVDSLVAGFKPQEGVSYTQAEAEDILNSNYAPANIGQLKAVAKPFYERLISAGYDPKLNLIARGYPAGWASNFPWPSSGSSIADNYSPANTGQLKMTFSFELGGVVLADTDNDKLLDSWETQYFTNLGRNGLSDYDGDGVWDLSEFLAQTNPVVANGSGAGFSVTKLSVYTPLQ